MLAQPRLLSANLPVSTFCRTDRPAFAELQAHPPEPALIAGARFALIVYEPVLSLWGETELGSGWRCIPLNKAVGGSMDPMSAHVFGRAGDLRPRRISIAEAFDRLLHGSIAFDKAILERKHLRSGAWESWIHLQISDAQVRDVLAPARRIALMSFDAKTYAAWNPQDPRVRALAHA